MPRFNINFVNSGVPGNRTVEANDETQARVRFLNHADVSFQPVNITSIREVGEDTTVAAKAERVGRRKVGQLPDKGWRNEVQKLTAEIDALADEKQAAARKSDWDKADALQEKIRKRSIEREKLVKQNGPGAARS